MEIKKKVQESKSDKSSINLTDTKKYSDDGNSISDILFKQVAVGVAIISVDGKWVKVNKRICDIFGYNEEELFSQHFLQIRHPDDSNINLEHIQNFMKGNNDNLWLDMCYTNRYSFKGWINLNATLVRDKKNVPSYFLAIIEDISARKTAEENIRVQHETLKKLNKQLKKTHIILEKKTEELEKASKYKSEFLANMSHELRSPLNSLLILARILADNEEGNLSKDQVQYASIIYKGGESLLELINDILDLSKIEVGKMTMYISEFHISDIEKNINTIFNHVAHEKNLDLNIHIHDNLPQIIKSDQQKLEQIIKNFISNAIKFTAKGSVTLEVSRSSPNTEHTIKGLEPGKSLAFSVIDTGIGIPVEKQRSIFEAFHQADGSTTRNFGGTGLGLSISHEYAKFLRGEIQLKSSVDSGSTFTLYIPESIEVSKNVKSDRRSTKRKKSQPDLAETIKYKKTLFEHKKILIADDDMRNLYALSKTIEAKGATVLKAANGQKTLEILEKEPGIDMLLLDIMMPIIDGYETMRRIRSQKQFKNLPILVVTAKAMKEDRDKCMSKGANEYISKPIDIDKLFSLMKKWLDKTVS